MSVLDYVAEDSCPNADAFLRAVLARSTRLRAANESEAARTLHVTIARSADGNVEGAFSLSTAEDPLRPSVTRVISGGSCSEVFDALTLVAEHLDRPLHHHVEVRSDQLAEVLLDRQRVRIEVNEHEALPDRDRGARGRRATW